MSEEMQCMAETLEESGWTAKFMVLGSYATPVGTAGHNDRYFVGPNYFDLSHGCMLVDHVRRVMCIAPMLPTPRRASQLLAKYGTPLEAVAPSIESMLRIPDEDA
jgi:hypothetical protein